MRRSFQAGTLGRRWIAIDCNEFCFSVFPFFSRGKKSDLFWPFSQERRLLWRRARILRNLNGTPQGKILSVLASSSPNASVELYVQSQWFLRYLDTRRLAHPDGTTAKRLRHHETDSSRHSLSVAVLWGAPLWDRLEAHWWGSPLEPWMQITLSLGRQI